MKSVLDLAPVNWTATVARDDVKQKLEANLFRQASLGLLKPAEKKSA